MSPTERRSSLRIPAQCHISYFHLPPTSHAPTFRSLNLSAIGACLESPTAFMPGSSLAFHMITPDRQVIDVQAQIVHSKTIHPALYHVGVRFTHLAQRDRAAIEQQIQSSI